MKGKFAYIFLASMVSNSAFCMLRTVEYTSLTQINGHQVCVSNKHEHNPLPEYADHPLNIEEPIVCKLTIAVDGRDAYGNIEIYKARTYQRFEFGKLTPSCVEFDKSLPHEIRSFAGLAAICATEEAAGRVFEDYLPILKAEK